MSVVKMFMLGLVLQINETQAIYEKEKKIASVFMSDNGKSRTDKR